MKKQRLHLQLFPKTLSDNGIILVTMGCYTKLARAFPTSKTTVFHIASLLVDNWVDPYAIPKSFLTDSGAKFTSTFSKSLCVFFYTKHLTTTVYHPQASGLAERFNNTTIAGLRHYGAEYQRDWDVNVQAWTYLYTAQLHRLKSLSPCCFYLPGRPLNLVLSIILQPCQPTKIDNTFARTKSKSTTPRRSNVQRRRQ